MRVPVGERTVHGCLKHRGPHRSAPLLSSQTVPPGEACNATLHPGWATAQATSYVYQMRRRAQWKTLQNMSVLTWICMDRSSHRIERPSARRSLHARCRRVSALPQSAARPDKDFIWLSRQRHQQSTTDAGDSHASAHRSSNGSLRPIAALQPGRRHLRTMRRCRWRSVGAATQLQLHAAVLRQAGNRQAGGRLQRGHGQRCRAAGAASAGAGQRTAR